MTAPDNRSALASVSVADRDMTCFLVETEDWTVVGGPFEDGLGAADAREEREIDASTVTAGALDDLVDAGMDVSWEIDDGDGPWIKGVFAKLSEDHVLHTNEDCPYLQRAKTYREALPAEREEFDECWHCRGKPSGAADGDGGGRDHLQSLKEAAEESDDDVVTDGGVEPEPRIPAEFSAETDSSKLDDGVDRRITAEEEYRYLGEAIERETSLHILEDGGVHISQRTNQGTIDTLTLNAEVVDRLVDELVRSEEGGPAATGEWSVTERQQPQQCDRCDDHGYDVSTVAVDGETVFLCRPCNDEVFRSDADPAEVLADILEGDDELATDGGRVEGESGEEYSILDEIEELNEQFQEHATYGGVSSSGIAGYHAMFSHDAGLDFAGEAALHAAFDEILMEVTLDPDIVEENQGEMTPATMATELREQMHHFTTLNDRFIERLATEFEEKLRGYQSDLEEAE